MFTSVKTVLWLYTFFLSTRGLQTKEIQYFNTKVLYDTDDERSGGVIRVFKIHGDKG